MVIIARRRGGGWVSKFCTSDGKTLCVAGIFSYQFGFIIRIHSQFETVSVLPRKWKKKSQFAADLQIVKLQHRYNLKNWKSNAQTQRIQV